MQKIKKGDEVIVIAGRSKGAHGAVLKFKSKTNNDFIVVEGANTVKKHVKPNPNAGIEGGIMEREAPLHISNVAIYNPATKKADKVGIKTLEDGRKVRVFKSNQEQIDS